VLPKVVDVEFQACPWLLKPLVNDELPMRWVFWLQLDPVLALEPFTKVEEPMRLTL